MELRVKVVILNFTLVLEVFATTSLLAIYFRSILVMNELVVIVGGCQIAR
jgi:hypothetical protein